MQGRGQARLVERSTMPASSSQEAGAETTKLQSLRSFCKRVDELTRKFDLRGREQVAQESDAQQLWEKIAKESSKHLRCQQGLDMPTMDSLRHIREEAKEALRDEVCAIVKDRQSAWKDWTGIQWNTNQRAIHDLVRESENGSLCVMARPDGSLTGHLNEIDSLLRQHWLPIFQKYDTINPEPSWDAFRQEYGCHVPQNGGVRLGKLEPAQLLETLRRMNPNTSVGADAWSVKDLKGLPLPILQRLCDLFSLIEDTGTWPRAISVGMITPLIKSNDEGLGAANTRPITVMSCLYRLWASTRMHELLQWQETWLSEEVSSYRPGMGCEDTWYAEALLVEEALLAGEPLAGMNLDFMKAFDMLPHSILFGIAEHMGLCPRVLRPLRGIYRSLRRQFKVGGLVGPSFASSNGILQGCPISVLLLNMYVETWCRCIRERVPGANPRGYADDVGATGPGAGCIIKALEVTDGFSTASGMRVSAGKSGVWGTTPAIRLRLSSCHIHGDRVPLVTQDRLLGAQLAYNKRRAPSRITKQLDTCIRMCERIGGLPLSLERRGQLVAMFVIPKSHYAVATGRPNKKHMAKLRAACGRAIWGQANRWRANQVLYTVLCPGHRCDPNQAADYLTILTTRRVLTKHPTLLPVIQRILDLRQDGFAGRSHMTGPGHAFHHALRRSGAAVDLLRDIFYWNCPKDGVQQMRFIVSETPKLQHNLREAMRAEQWRHLQAHREGYDGAQHGIEKGISVALFKNLTGLDRYRLRCCMAGAVMTLRRLRTMGQIANVQCRCGCEVETWRHVVDDCPLYDAIRYRDMKPTDWHSLPECLRLRGLLPNIFEEIPRDDLLEFTATVQYALIDILSLRQESLPPELAPAQRWA